MSLQSFTSHTRQYIVNKDVYGLKNLNILVTFRSMWIPAHRGIKGNEVVGCMGKTDDESCSYYVRFTWLI